MNSDRTVHLRIEGQVQGVGFRAWLAARARDLELSGWVRNRSDWTVEAVISGAPDHVDDMLQRCEEGPPHARVTRVEVLDEDAGAFTGFEVRSTV